MKHICYVYIYDYKCLKDIEITLDCHYRYKYEKDNRILTITKNKDFPSHFWGNNIYSVTGIVGNNGAGKSTVMSFLLNFLVEGSACESINGIIVYENNGELFYYGENVTVIYDESNLTNTKTPMGLRDSEWKIPCFYYSGHFSPLFNNDPRNSYLSGSYMASDNMLLVMDHEKEYNVDSMHLNWPLEQHLRSFVAQNNYRICMMLANKELAKIIKDFAWPYYVLIGINQSGATAIDNAIREKNLIREKYGQEPTNTKRPVFKPVVEDITSLNYFLSLLIYHNLLNIIYDRWGWQNGFDIVDDWQKKIKPDSDVLAQFQAFVSGIDDEEKKGPLLSLYQILTQTRELTEYKEGILNNNGWLYIDCFNKNDNLIKLVDEVLKNDFYLTSKFFDFFYAQSLDSATVLSSGEQELLNLFSRMYDAIILKPNKFSNLILPYLLLLDEAEIGFHPDWQRRYLKLLLVFLDALKEIFNKSQDFQIIISTHSPILLSDIPKCCVNYLKKENSVTKNARDVGETFAENVFNLYRLSFFMEDGLVGEFARNKIKELNERIDDGETDDVINEIRMIGDSRIQKYLMDKYEKKHQKDGFLNDEIIKYYEEKIKQLKG